MGALVSDRRVYYLKSAMSPKATNSVAGGNATGMDGHDSDPERVASNMIFDPCRVGTLILWIPVALPPAIKFDAFGVKRIRKMPNPERR